MSRIPNPFLGGPGQQQTTPKKPSTPGFLLLTRPATGSNSYGGGGRSYGGQHSPSISSPPGSTDGFIPFSTISDSSNNRNHDSNRRGGNRGGGGGGGRYYGGGGGRHMSNQTSPRFSYPYQQSPGRMSNHGSNHYGQGQNYSNSPRGNQNYGNQRGGRFGGHNRYGNNNHGNNNHGNARGPISDIPIDKFVSTSMIQDPWAEFEEDEAIVAGSSPLVTLDNSEIIIDSDASVVIENSYEEGISGTEGDSSPVHDTGSDSPYIATSSTSEKDTGSDSTSDA